MTGKCHHDIFLDHSQQSSEERPVHNGNQTIHSATPTGIERNREKC